MRLAIFTLMLLTASPVLAQGTPYSPYQTREGATITTSTAPVVAQLTPSPPSFPPQTPTAPPAAAAAGPDPTIQNLWRSDAGLDAAAELMKQRKYSEALPLLELAVQRNMRNADAHVYSAICWTNLGNFEKAKAALSNAYAIDKGHMGAYVVGGVVALQQGDKTQANYFLSAIRTVCQGDLCTEYQTLKKAINEAK